MNDLFSKTIRKLRDLGKNKKGVFVCNLNLKKSFNVGDEVDYNYDFENKVLTVIKNQNGNHRVSFRKSEPDMPILDIKNQTVFQLFQDAEKVEVCFYPNRVEIKLSKVEKLKQQRETNSELTTFELFCGGSTMSKMFRQAGFTPIGGLEINEKCLELAEYNHDTFKYTILADIRDVHSSDYLKNVNTVLAGIPCPPFSKANKKMQEALKRQKEGRATEEDLELLESRYEAEALTFFVLESLRAINPKNIVIEEVVEYADTSASHMLRRVLKSMGYKLSETINEGSHTKRPRWCLLATASKESINLENLLPQTNKTIDDFLDVKSKDRDWKPKEEIQRLLGASKKPKIGGIRYCLPTDTKCNTFTTLKTRHTESCLRKSENEELYSEFTNNEIAKIHGLVDYKLKNVDKWNRIVLGNGVTDMFFHIAKRIKDAMEKIEVIEELKCRRQYQSTFNFFSQNIA